MATINCTGNFDNIDKLFANKLSARARNIMEIYAKQGVAALAAATPVDTGLDAASWDYKIEPTERGFRITWTNSDTTTYGEPIALLLQYGHGTRNGGYVEGRDFINPAIRSILDTIADELWKEVCNK